MGPYIEQLERRVLLSVPAGAYIFWTGVPSSAMAGQKLRLAIDVRDPNFHVVRSDNAAVQFTISLGSGAGQLLGTAQLKAGSAVLRNVILTKAGDFGILASSPGVQAIQAGFTVYANRGSAMHIAATGFNAAFPMDYDVRVTMTDKFGNTATGDFSILRLGRITPAVNIVNFVAAYGPGEAAPNIVMRNGSVYGVRFDQGSASFTLQYSGPPGQVTAELVDTNPRIRPILTPAFPINPAS
jgi:hypothetical protein